MSTQLFDRSDIKLFEQNLIKLKTLAPTWQNNILCGIEREALRINPQGHIAMTAHPLSLGSALTHPEITTDFSEALLEFITPPISNTFETIDYLYKQHQFVVQQLKDELLWPFSMPALLPADHLIPIANYGYSNLGRGKTIYRHGLALRYGRKMQCIAGIHFNFSLGDLFWKTFLDEKKDEFAFRKSAGYFSLIRNFDCYGWLLLYLFGASPAFHSSFLPADNRNINLDQLTLINNDTWIAPYATSLRMSDIGYQNKKARETIRIPFDNLDNYLSSIRHSLAAQDPNFLAMGVKRNGEWLQLNGNTLQIENELYATIRPKCRPTKNLRLIDNLRIQGVEYIEARTIDIDPFSVCGMSSDTLRFLQIFMTWCAIFPSKDDEVQVREINSRNFSKVALLGRKPHFEIFLDKNQTLQLKDAAAYLFEQLQLVAQHFDQSNNNSNQYQLALEKEYKKVIDVSKTPAAKVLNALENSNQNMLAFGLNRAQRYKEILQKENLDEKTLLQKKSQACQSLIEQKAIEKHQLPDSLDQYILSLSNL